MKNFFFAASLLLTAPIANSASANNPIAGTWRSTVEGTTCVEVYTFKTNGVRNYQSASEAGESKYTISSAPSPSGYYKFTDVITKTNGQPDCMGHTSPIGDSISAYIRFGPSNKSFFFCENESQNMCIGPFSKSADSSSP